MKEGRLCTQKSMLVSKLFIVETPKTASASAALVQNGVLEETGTDWDIGPQKRFFQIIYPCFSVMEEPSEN